MNEQADLNRLRRQVAFDRLLARLFLEESPPCILKGGYALELRFKAARSTVDIDLTVERVPPAAGDDQNQIVQDMLQTAAAVPRGDWFEFTFGRPAMDLTAAPYGGARYPVEARMDERIFPDFTWTPALVTWYCHRWRRSPAGTGWDSPVSSPRGFG